ncbi:ThiF family adenylyltransferase [Brevundimonas sp.]|uniref:ThiF family adenylyltransferase n=1 Tax=Brevundimonas sp. TaxID=1871086 RepID=UPI002ABAE6CE|nr:ThiF family adenylyltransferase [Brevundimonas sp.]MDZ4365270.1 ThiF family adenylyltransferase [Brevundimonas sp.]
MTGLATSAWSSIERALKGRSFGFAFTRRGVTAYVGQVRSGQIDVPLRVEITDPLMMPPPKIFITDDAVLTRIGAHLNTDRSLCYAEEAVEEYDPYNAGGAVLRILESVKTTLGQVLHSSSAADLQREFVAYWKAETFLFTDLPAGFSGKAKTVVWTKAGRTSLVVTVPNRLTRWSDAKARDADEAYVLKSDRPFNTSVGEGPGDSLASLRKWMGRFVDDQDAVARAFVPGLVDKGTVVLMADNGAVAATFAWPTVAKLAYAGAPANRRARSIAHGETQMALEKSVAESLALPELVNARLAAPSPLIGKSVAVVGAGAIGSRVCLELARSGAGQSELPLLIVDPDLFLAANFARHVLPISAVRQPKATAMMEELRRIHPGLNVEGVDRSAFDMLHKLAAYDLVIDATGANPVALRLNAEAVSRRQAGMAFPPILHAAIHGNGLAAQTVLVTPTGHACFKCLRPEHGSFKANPLKPGVATAFESASCGDGAHVTYAASAPALAAALVVQAVLDWAAAPAEPGPRVRSRVLDIALTAPPKDRNWPVDPQCPACQAPAA